MEPSLNRIDLYNLFCFEIDQNEVQYLHSCADANLISFHFTDCIALFNALQYFIEINPEQYQNCIEFI